MKLRVEGGESSLQDQRQAEQSLYEVSQNVPALRQSIAQTENALSVLAGDYPHAIERGLPLDQQVKMPDVPPTGLSSALLQSRPDIRESGVCDRGGGRERRRRAQAAVSVHHARRVGGDRRSGFERRLSQRYRRVSAARGDQQRLLWPARLVFDSAAAAAADLQRPPDPVADTLAEAQQQHPPSRICKPSTERSRKSRTTRPHTIKPV